MSYGDATSIYIENGWNSPIPLPMGQKFPPPDETTGNYPEIDPALIEAWANERADDNIGLRMPRFRMDDKPYEVIGIDVDQYGIKKGWESLLHLTAKYGPLPATWKSSHWPDDNPSGIYFFLVPAGKKWLGKAGSDIEVIQRTHRYAVCWPSEFEDTTYGWFMVPETEDGALATPVDGPPDVADLPELPAEWVEHLMKGSASDLRVNSSADTGITSARSAREWMSANLPGFDKLPSSEMARACNSDELSVEASGGAHDMIVGRIHRCVMLATEGHHGIRQAIKNIQQAFQAEVMGELEEEAERRSVQDMRSEFDRALVGEIIKLKQDIDAGYMMVSAVGGMSAEDSDIDTGAVLRRLAQRRAMPEMSDYQPSDLGRARAIVDAWNDMLRPIAESKDQWGFWNEAKLAFEKMPHERLVTDVWGPTIIEGYTRTSKALFDQADIEEEGDTGDFKATSKKAVEYDALAKSAGNRNTILAGMALAHAISNHRISENQIDANPLTLGVGNGVLDFTRPQENKLDYLRDGSRDDLILATTGVDYVPGAEHPLWKSTLETFLPDPAYRRFVQRVFGYALRGRNPDRLLIFIQGPSSTGKSTFSDAIRSALGKDYADTIAANALFREKQDAGPAPELLQAASKRIVFSSEISQHNRLHADVIKRLTGGSDEIAARALYSNAVVSRIPMFTPIIATNSMPTIADGDDALWRRLLVLPFDHQVPLGKVQSDNIRDHQEAREAVLAWLVDGFLDYQEHGLHPSDWPDICKSRNREFISGTSVFQNFISEHLVKVEGKKVEAAKLFSLYQAWCGEQSMRQADLLTRPEFYQRMDGNGMPKTESSIRVEGRSAPRKVAVFQGVAFARKPE